MMSAEHSTERYRMAEGYDYHFMVLAPGLQSAWFFQAARRFWQVFQPIVTDKVDLLTFLPLEATVAVTLLARSDTAGYAKDTIVAVRPDARLDMVMIDDLPLMESILNARADSGLPFG
jgi:hypothetical protein